MSENKNIQFIVRLLQESDFNEVREIWTILGFLASKYDNEVMIKVDGKGIFVAQELSTGKIIGSCSGVNLSPQLAHMGQYGVRKEYQKLGIGQKLWERALEHIGTDRNIGLYSRQYMADKYTEKYNFNVIPNSKLSCYIGNVDSSQLIKAIDGISVIPFNENNIESVIQYDREVCRGVLDRSVLIRENAKFEEYVNLVAINQTHQVLGFCMLKVSTTNKGLIEPLYANDEKIAELLVAKCCQSMAITQTNGLIYNCWNTNLKSIDIAKKMGLTFFNELPVLFTQNIVQGDMDRIYCMCSRAFYPF